MTDTVKVTKVKMVESDGKMIPENFPPLKHDLTKPGDGVVYYTMWSSVYGKDWGWVLSDADSVSFYAQNSVF